VSLIDLHTHTRHGSICGYMWADELVEQAKKIGLDGVCITEHDNFWKPERIEKLARKHNFMVIGGAEVTTDCGEVLIFGLHDLPFDVSGIEEVRQRIDQVGGVMIAAHPFRGLAATRSVNDNPSELADSIAQQRLFQYVNELEVLNGASGVWERKLAYAVAGCLQMKGTGGSDAHGITAVGTCYTHFEREIRNEQDFIKEIREGRFKAGNELVCK
jgi:predicted metal-dependent phosphoesterase TrpH